MNFAVVFAGGIGARMGNPDIPKQFLPMYGKPIIIHTLERFDNHPQIDGIVVACVEPWIPHLTELVERHGLQKVRRIIPGGTTSQLSIFNGLKAVDGISSSGNDIVLIHDGVRPLIDDALISANIEAVKEFGSAISCSKVIETIVNVDDSDNITHIHNRTSSRYAKAPQSFFFADLLAAHRKALTVGRSDFIDSCSLMDWVGKTLHLVECSDDNIKVTTPKDYYMLKAFLDLHENSKVF